MVVMTICNNVFMVVCVISIFFLIRPTVFKFINVN